MLQRVAIQTSKACGRRILLNSKQYTQQSAVLYRPLIMKNLPGNLLPLMSIQTRQMSSYKGPIRGQKNDGIDTKRRYLNSGPIPLAIAGTVLVATAAYYGLPYMKVSRSTYDDDALEELEDHMANVWRDIVNEEHLEDGALASGQAKLTEKITKFLKNILSTQELVDTLADLLARVLASKRFQEAAQTLLMALWEDLLADPETLLAIMKLLQKAIEDERVQESVQKLIIALIKDKQVYDELTRLLVSLGNEPRVLEATQDLLIESAHNALNDKDILSHSMEFATKLVGDESIQRTTGEALRNTVTYAVKPGLSSFLYGMGVGLIMIGFMALVNSRASEREMEIVDRAMITVGGNMQSAAKESFTFPFRFMQAAAHKLLTRIAHVGKALVSAISRVIGRTLRLPIDLSRSIARSVTSALSAAVGSISVILYDSLLGQAVKNTWAIISNVSAASWAGASGVASWISYISRNATTLVWTWCSDASQWTVLRLSSIPFGISMGVKSMTTQFSFVHRELTARLASILLPVWSKTWTHFSNAPKSISDAIATCITYCASCLNSARSSASSTASLMSSFLVSTLAITMTQTSTTGSKLVALFQSHSLQAVNILEIASSTTKKEVSKFTESVSASIEKLSAWLIRWITGHGSASTL